MNPQALDWKVIFGAIGLLGLAVYQFSIGEIAGGIQSVLAAVAAFSIKRAYDNNSYLLQVHNKYLLSMKNPSVKLTRDEKKLLTDNLMNASEEEK